MPFHTKVPIRGNNFQDNQNVLVVNGTSIYPCPILIISLELFYVKKILFHSKYLFQDHLISFNIPSNLINLMKYHKEIIVNKRDLARYSRK
jgi:hypothetical protein